MAQPTPDFYEQPYVTVEKPSPMNDLGICSEANYNGMGA